MAACSAGEGAVLLLLLGDGGGGGGGALHAAPLRPRYVEGACGELELYQQLFNLWKAINMGGCASLAKRGVPRRGEMIWGGGGGDWERRYADRIAWVWAFQRDAARPRLHARCTSAARLPPLPTRAMLLLHRHCGLCCRIERIAPAPTRPTLVIPPASL
jgi:hypothetical protein